MKKVLTWVLCFVVVQGALSADAFAIQLNQPVPPRKLAHLSQAIGTLGLGPDALVAVRLRDKSVVSGYLGRVERNFFVVVETRTGEESVVPFLQVSRLAGMNLITGVQVHEGGGFRSKLARVAGFLLPGRRVTSNSLTGTEKILLIGILLGVLIAIVVAKTV